MSARFVRTAVACGFALSLALITPAAGAAQAASEPTAAPDGKKRARSAQAKPARKREKTARSRAKPRAASVSAAPAHAPSAEKSVTAEPGAGIQPARAGAEAPAGGKRSAANGPTAPAEARAASPAGTPDAAEAAAAISGDADESVRKEGDHEVKVVEFGGLDIEGQLKSPQMLYFLNRLRAEFDRPELPHRSFMPELQRGTKEPGF